ncbi:DUF4145 domain-containing protein [Priestia aryabhattai]|uniref:hypothetical protein n=1 Tax=Priestia aryabhattai TaxID=412384 RepID=UPI001C8E72C3|nr:hypothetical protein [Priestia aryabhattai]MBX9999586.1 DUF4145 domain-containing protein [Priestia aryabhattai]
MSVDYRKKFKVIGSEKDVSDYIELVTLPDECPVCSHSISPNYILIYYKESWINEVLCGCPRNDCRSLFFAVYQKSDYNQKYKLKKYYPYSKREKGFPDEINDVSSEFIKIYNQAYHAEQSGLNLICGGAYRKALEYLIKDFISVLHPDETEKIKAMPLQRCVQKFIEQVEIKDMAERAIWLGNDETHYIRKWDSKDIKDLKNLIDLTVYYISMSIKAKKYREEMSI